MIFGLQLTFQNKNGNKKYPHRDPTKKAATFLRGHGVWGSGSAGDSWRYGLPGRFLYLLAAKIKNRLRHSASPDDGY